MNENKLDTMYSSEDQENLELIRLKNSLADLMRQQESLTNNFELQGVDVNSPKAQELLGPISKQIAEINEQIELVDKKELVEEAA